jgi:bifunctional non-homologous end joining protein LigD
MEGVLRSWAVPKGPSLDPSEKRLAVQVEDHPLEYGKFEGTIPKGEYGGGTVLLWDRGRWIPEGDPDPVAAWKAGSLKFRLEGEKLRGSWALVRMKSRDEDRGRANWLLIKHRDAEAQPLSKGDILEERPESVATGRALEEIATGTGGSREWSSNRKSATAARETSSRKTTTAARSASSRKATTTARAASPRKTTKPVGGETAKVGRHQSTASPRTRVAAARKPAKRPTGTRTNESRSPRAAAPPR